MKEIVNKTNLVIAAVMVIGGTLAMTSAVVEGRPASALMSIAFGLLGWEWYRESMVEINKSKHKSVDEL